MKRATSLLALLFGLMFAIGAMAGPQGAAPDAGAQSMVEQGDIHSFEDEDDEDEDDEDDEW